MQQAVRELQTASENLARQGEAIDIQARAMGERELSHRDTAARLKLAASSLAKRELEIAARAKALESRATMIGEADRDLTDKKLDVAAASRELLARNAQLALVTSAFNAAGSGAGAGAGGWYMQQAQAQAQAQAQSLPFAPGKENVSGGAGSAQPEKPPKTPSHAGAGYGGQASSSSSSSSSVPTYSPQQQGQQQQLPGASDWLESFQQRVRQGLAGQTHTHAHAPSSRAGAGGPGSTLFDAKKVLQGARAMSARNSGRRESVDRLLSGESEFVAAMHAKRARAMAGAAGGGGY